MVGPHEAIEPLDPDTRSTPPGTALRNGAVSHDPETWVDRHGDCLYRYALLRLREPELAADAVQETFLEALRSRASFAGRSSERTWLVGILKHKIVDHLRRSRREQPLASTTAPGAADDSFFDRRGFWKGRFRAWSGDPSHALETHEFWDVFGNCLAKLPPATADAFFLRELDGLSGEEVHQLLQITPANLWTRLHRARLLLRRCLESNWFGSKTRS
jgi:RNA polymerase sigma-70 factor, ECF subfamily